MKEFGIALLVGTILLILERILEYVIKWCKKKGAEPPVVPTKAQVDKAYRLDGILTLVTCAGFIGVIAIKDTTVQSASILLSIVSIILKQSVSGYFYQTLQHFYKDSGKDKSNRR